MIPVVTLVDLIYYQLRWALLHLPVAIHLVTDGYWPVGLPRSPAPHPVADIYGCTYTYVQLFAFDFDSSWLRLLVAYPLLLLLFTIYPGWTLIGWRLPHTLRVALRYVEPLRLRVTRFVYVVIAGWLFHLLILPRTLRLIPGF